MYKFAETITKASSRGYLVPAEGTATFYNGGTSDLATLYADDEIATLSNPLTADDEGLVECKLNNGVYDVVLYDGVREKRINGLVAFDGQAETGQVVSSDIATVVTCSTAIPVDDTIPQNTEGTEVLTRSITPSSASSTLEITLHVTGSATGTAFITAAVFKDSGADALSGSISSVQSTGVNQKAQLSWTFRVSAGSTSAQTFKLRVGPSTGTFYVNGNSSGSRIFGGNAKAQMTIREILA